jgi:hypothetical protein
MPQTIDLVSDEPLDATQVAYFCERFRSQVYYAIVETFRKEVEEGNLTQATLSRRLNKDPAIVSKWFSGPRNFQLDSISEVLLAMGAEPELRVNLLREPILTPNYAHPLVEELAGNYPEPKIVSITSTETPRGGIIRSTPTGSRQENSAFFTTRQPQ